MARTLKIINIPTSATSYDIVPDATWWDADVVINAYRSAVTNPNGCVVVIQLPAADPSWVGFECYVKRIDPVAGDVRCQVTSSSDRLNHFWGSTHPYGVSMPVVQDSAKLWYGGPWTGELIDNNGNPVAGWNDWHFDPLSKVDGPTEQLTLADPTRADFLVNPNCHRKMLRANVGAAGAGHVTLYPDFISNWLPPSPLTGGNYLSRWFYAMKMDPAANGPLIIASTNCGPIHPNNDTVPGRGYYYVYNQGECVKVYVASDGVTVIGADQSGAPFAWN